ncbi:MAG TPA: SRPBCC family protein [Puia sp.]|nr:SRPBCC family protein [Puia sp.]
MATDKILTKTIHLKAPVSKVWNALTNPDIIKEWLFGTNVITDWKVGSPIIFTGTWQGTEYKDKGTILQFEKEKIFQYNYWSGFSGLADSIENYSVIGFELAPFTSETQLILTQSNFPSEAAYEHTEKNWGATLEQLKTIIEK